VGRARPDLFGALLVLAAAFVRVRLPGGVAFAIGAMLGLQALAVHDAVHLGTGVAPADCPRRNALLLVTIAAVPTLPRRNTLNPQKSFLCEFGGFRVDRRHRCSDRTSAASTRF
jgi:hypothetical protein